MKKLSLLFVSIVVFNFFLFLTDIDIKILENTLYYQHADFEIHRLSDSPQRLYELCPGASKVGFDLISPLEKYQERKVTINSLGFRDKERAKFKPQGIFRIIIIGGSNTYGGFVRDQDTYPAIMDRYLNEKVPGKFEVWNAGVNAYVLSQMIAYAEYIVENFNPDILIFELGNGGRRAFLYNQDFKGLFKKNKELFLENIPFLFSNRTSIQQLHYWLVKHFRVYRFFLTTINSLTVQYYCHINKIKINRQYGQKLPLEELSLKYDFYGNLVNEREFKRFVKEHSNIKLIIFDPVGGNAYRSGKYGREHNVKYFSLSHSNTYPEYRSSHPPSYVYEWYAKELINMLFKNNYISF